MSSSKNRSREKFVQILVVVLALTATPKLLSSLPSTLIEPVLAQSASPSPTFPLPKSLPSGTTVKLDGSSSMRVINEALRKRFEEKFPGSKLELASGGTDGALAALLRGDINLVAVGRALTPEEKAQGLVAVPVSREKIAIIVGADNPFKKNLTFEQFAKMFRGEITDWSQVGGAPGKIRFIDHPDSSDTRRSLSTYQIFKKAPFVTGANATRLPQEDTAAVVQALGKDGISYAITDQVIDLPNVRVIPMHKTMPDDPRYPYSQPRGYVYRKQTTDPGVLAYLGFATSPPGKEIVEEAKEQEIEAVRESTTTAASPTPSPEATAPSPSPATSPNTALVPAPTGDADATATRERDWTFLWWLLLLLGIPLLGFLLWRLKGGRGRSSATEETPATPAATPTVPPGTTGASATALDTTPSTPVGTSSGAPGIVGGIAGATAGAVAGGAVAAGYTFSSRIWLEVRNLRELYAQWDVPSGDKEAAKQQGGQQYHLRIYDVTDIDLDSQQPHSMQGYDCNESDTARVISDPRSDRDYIAEIGYLTGGGQWLLLARSNPVRISSTSEAVEGISGETLVVPTPDNGAPGIVGGIAGATAGAVAGGAVAAGYTFNSRIWLEVRNLTQLYAHWDVPSGDKEAAKQQGGQQYHLRIYDVTDIDLDSQQAHSMQGYDCNESDTARVISDPRSDRDYIAEIGYLTGGGQWLRLARSNPVRISSTSEAVEGISGETLVVPTPDNGTAGIVGGIAGATAGAVAGGAIPAGYTFNSRIWLEVRNLTQLYAQWDVPSADKEAAKQQGGVQYHLRIYDVTDIDLDSQQAHSMQGYDCSESDTARVISDPRSDRDYIAEIGYLTGEGQWLLLARSNSVRISSTSKPIEGTTADTPIVPTPENVDSGIVGGIAGLTAAALAGGATLAGYTFNSRIWLEVRSSTQLYAQWDVPSADKEAAQQQGGQQYHLRIYDITDIDLDSQPAHSMQGYDCNESDTARVISDPRSERDYLAEIGYITDEGHWLLLARSKRVRISSTSEAVEGTTGDTPVVLTPENVALGAAGLVDGGAALAGHTFNSRIWLEVRNLTQLYAQWDVPSADKEAAKQQGGVQYHLRIYDVTDIDLDSQQAHSMQGYDCNESDTARLVLPPISDRDYVAEIGYLTAEGQWLRLARSNSVRISSTSEPIEGTTGETPIVPTPENAASGIVGGIAGLTAAAVAGGAVPAGYTFSSRIWLEVRTLTQLYAQWDVPSADKEATKQQGGVQFHLRIYDVTDIDLDSQPVHSIQGHDCSESDTARVISDPRSDRDYVAEIGYLTTHGQWLLLARSNSVRVSSSSPTISDQAEETPVVPTAETAALGAAGLVDGAAALAGHTSNSRIWLEARNSTQVYAQWDVPSADKEAAKQQGGVQFHLRIYEVSDINLDTQPAESMQGYDCNESETARLVSVPVSDRDYIAEIGYITGEGQWLLLARSNPVTVSSTSLPVPDTDEQTPVVPTSDEISTLGGVGIVAGAIAGAAALAGHTFNSRIWLEVRNSTQVYAQWDVPSADKEAAKQQGGVQFHLRIYEVSDINLDTQPAESMQGYDCNESETARLVSVPVSDRDYIAEIGYVTGEGQWLLLARSNSVRVSSTSEAVEGTTGETPEIATLGAAGVVDGGVALAGYTFNSRIWLEVRNSTQLYAQWDVPSADKETVKQQGGQQCQLRVYDVTDIDLNTQPTQSLQSYDCDELSHEQHISIPTSNRDYVAEIGYLTGEGQWLLLARSNRVRISSTSEAVEGISGDTPVVPTPENVTAGMVGGIAGVAAGAIAVGTTLTGQASGSRIWLEVRNSTQVYAKWDIPQADREAAKQQGGQHCQLRVYEVNDINLDVQPTQSLQSYDCDELTHERQISIPAKAGKYVVEIGYLTSEGQWLLLARSNSLRVSSTSESVERMTGEAPVGETAGISTGMAGLTAGAIAVGTTLTGQASGSRIWLEVRNSTQVYAKWDIPQSDREAAKQQGGQHCQLRVYEVNDINLDVEPTQSLQSYDCDELSHQQQISIPAKTGKYVVEIGYLTSEGRWLLLARSNSLRVSSTSESVQRMTGEAPVGETAGISTGMAGLIAGAIAAGTTLTGQSSGSRIWLEVRNSTQVYAKWDIPQADREAAKRQGGQQCQLRVYEVSDINLDVQPTESLQSYDCDELSHQQQISIPTSVGNYVVEIGYLTTEGQWLLLARSNPVRVSSISPIQWSSGETPVGETSRIATGVAGATTRTIAFGTTLTGGTSGSRIWLEVRNSTQVYAKWDIPQSDKEAVKQQGGQQCQLRVYQVSDTDLNNQLTESLQSYDCDELSHEQQISIPTTAGKYVVEIGYVTIEGQWLLLARSNSVRVSSTSESVQWSSGETSDSPTLGITGGIAETIGTVTGGTAIGVKVGATQQSISSVNTAESLSESSSGEVLKTVTRREGCKIQNLTVHSRNNCFRLNEERMRKLQETAVSKTLEPGIYIVRLKSGTFGYGSTVNPAGQPTALFWIYGGRVVNKKTNVPVPATWSSLHGYDDTLTLEILETATLCAFFFDTHADDNDGEVIVSVVRLYSHS